MHCIRYPQQRIPNWRGCSYVSMTTPLQSLSVTTLGSGPAMRRRDESSVVTDHARHVALCCNVLYFVATCIPGRQVQSPIMSPIGPSVAAARPQHKLPKLPTSEHYSGPPWACVQTLPVRARAARRVACNPPGGAWRDKWGGAWRATLRGVPPCYVACHHATRRAAHSTAAAGPGRAFPLVAAREPSPASPGPS
jgi:hypothetical protein